MLRSLVLAVLLLAAASAVPQMHPPEPTGTPTPSPEEIRQRHNMQKQLTKERYDQMRKEADQLLRLATELKQSVDSAGEHTLSLDVLKKTDQIEKLTKDIRSKMKSE